MLEIRFHGRGGQGAVTSVELLAIAAIEEGKFAQGFPSFGPERRGAPVMAFLRIDDRHIRLRCKIENPDVLLILDPSLIRIQNPDADLKPDGIIVLNTNKSIADTRREFGFTQTLAVVDANQIAKQVLGVPITNTTMLGRSAPGHRRRQNGVHARASQRTFWAHGHQKYYRPANRI